MTGESILTYKVDLRRQIYHYFNCEVVTKAEQRNRQKQKQQHKAKTKNAKKEIKKRRWYRIRRRINKWLRVGRRVAKYAVGHKYDKITSKTVKHLGTIPSIAACQIIKKYKNNKKCKRVSNVNLIVPACSTRQYPSVIHESGVLTIKPLKLILRWHCPIEYTKINQVEVNNQYVYITVSVPAKPSPGFNKMIGVDVNVKHNLAAVGNPETKKVDYLGKGHIYRRAKYLFMRSRYQRQGRPGRVKAMGNKEHRVMTDVNHKVSAQILDRAFEDEACISIEDLTGIRKAPSRGRFKSFLNSWGFYQLRTFIEYKAALDGIDVFAIDPAYTSQDCSGCGNRKKVRGKKYSCSECGLVIHRDENASYNISKRGSAELNKLNI